MDAGTFYAKVRVGNGVIELSEARGQVHQCRRRLTCLFPIATRCIAKPSTPAERASIRSRTSLTASAPVACLTRLGIDGGLLRILAGSGLDCVSKKKGRCVRPCLCLARVRCG